MEETAFLGMTRDTPCSAPVRPEKESSLLAEMVRLNRILQQINEFNIRASEAELDSPSLINNVNALSDQLNTWVEELPDRMRDTRANMMAFAAQGLGRIFVAIYLGYYHFGQMLFYRFLHEDTHGSSPLARNYASKCKSHATSLCEIVYASDTVPGCDVKYNMVGHVLVIASTVQIHSLLFGADNAHRALARARLEKNFCILTHLCRLWSTLDVCMERLMAFHKACRESADTSFCLDRWMVRFLVEFANPVHDSSAARAESRDSGNCPIKKIHV
ncbi:uncharacterized protein N7459_000417 [Penicillium hispanicum]|uniref:uncharacterized protein n=1 Tax=Penicillium hispanicum TaxID=1080232 RepID=UPI0025414E30|nr:uncharacterized protein N7459_000417 [Penicillium hispanicum]KAJ5594209.1 hypothetical protein N7459_000417 [Penicillium hispanicum]